MVQNIKEVLKVEDETMPLGQGMNILESTEPIQSN